VADIFVSYASEDRERVAPIAAFLESQGWTVWWDRRLDAGTSFDREIERELDAASCVLVSAVNSRWLAARIPEARLMLIDSKNHGVGFVGSLTRS
jgi:hypothetical protein